MTARELKEALRGLSDETSVVLGWYYNGELVHVPFTSASTASDPDTGKEVLLLQESTL